VIACLQSLGTILLQSIVRVALIELEHRKSENCVLLLAAAAYHIQRDISTLTPLDNLK